MIPQGEEAELASMLKTMSKWGFRLLKEEIKDVIQEYMQIHDIKIHLETITLETIGFWLSRSAIIYQ